MTATTSTDLVNLTIDGVPVSVPKNTLVIRAAEEVGVRTPANLPVPSLGPGEVGYVYANVKDLSLAKIGDQVRIIVRDTGPGIPAEDLPYIFERFYRAEKSRTRAKSTGFGLGLSIAQWIVENHGGTIEVESKEGQGTTFAVWLPLLPGQNKEKSKARMGEKNQGP